MGEVYHSRAKEVYQFSINPVLNFYALAYDSHLLLKQDKVNTF